MEMQYVVLAVVVLAIVLYVKRDKVKSLLKTIGGGSKNKTHLK